MNQSAINEITDIHTAADRLTRETAELTSALMDTDAVNDPIRTARRRLADATGSLTRAVDALAKAEADLGVAE